VPVHPEDTLKQALRLLQIEDSENDAALILRLLEKSGYEIDAERVESEAQMRAALKRGPWDLIISDYRLPQFSAPAALSVFRDSNLDIPFIVISGAVGEEIAVSIMRGGAHDFLLKDKLDRLLPAVDRELNEAQIRRHTREADQKLRAANAELEAIYTNAPVLMFVLNEQIQVEKINNCAIDFCGLTADGWRERKICTLLQCPHPAPASIRADPEESCTRCATWKLLADVFRMGIPRRSVEVWSQLNSEGHARGSCLLVSVAPIVVGHATRALVTAQDITRLKTVETSLQASVDSLKATLSEKTVLVQEIHHRVKNNLQIIASLLSIKARKSSSPDCVEDLKDCERRVKSMASIHEQLHRQSDMTRVEFGSYIGMIAPEIVACFARGDSIALRLELSAVALSVDQSIPCGLILNELLTNAVKYAYPEGKGEVAIGLSSDAGIVRLTVSDRGVGMSASSNRDGSSLGMQIMNMLTKKLGGAIEFESNHGTTATLSFPQEP
jgi:two-component sensor histidine kinase